MPTYEYECNKCGVVFEAFQKITAPPLTKCRECNAKGTVKRLVSAGVGLIFKGSGFYVTDYKRAGSAADKESTGEKKSETAEKPAKKKEKPDTAGSSKSSSSD